MLPGGTPVSSSPRPSADGWTRTTSAVSWTPWSRQPAPSHHPEGHASYGSIDWSGRRRRQGHAGTPRTLRRRHHAQHLHPHGQRQHREAGRRLDQVLPPVAAPGRVRRRGAPAVGGRRGAQLRADAPLPAHPAGGVGAAAGRGQRPARRRGAAFGERAPAVARGRGRPRRAPARSSATTAGGTRRRWTSAGRRSPPDSRRRSSSTGAGPGSATASTTSRVWLSGCRSPGVTPTSRSFRSGNWTGRCGPSGWP